MPFNHGLPILTFFLVKLFFPLRLRLFAVLANVAAFVTARAVAAFNVIVELALRFGSNPITIDDGFEIGSLQTGRELGGLFVVWAARKVGIGSVFRLVALVLVFGFVFSVPPFVFHLISFFLVFRFDIGLIEQVRDRRLNATKVRWVGTIVDRTFDSF